MEVINPTASHKHQIKIQGAHVNNLKDINVSIPRPGLVGIVGVSGSGKSSLAFEIIAREGQRQYFESLSNYVRKFLPKSNRPNVDLIDGISPTIVLDQRPAGKSPRSTVGTMSEVSPYLRLLFARNGTPVYDSSHFSFNSPKGACPDCKGLGKVPQIDLTKIIDLNKSLNEGAVLLKDWAVGGRMHNIVMQTGFFDMDKKLKDFSKDDLDKLLHSPKISMKDVIPGLVQNWSFEGVVTRLQRRNRNANRGPSQSDLKMFKFARCETCHGYRINPAALKVRIRGLEYSIGELSDMEISQLYEILMKLSRDNEKETLLPNAQNILPRLLTQLKGLIDVGVGYLSLNRSTSTLSGGEAQRIRLARQLAIDLTHIIYVLDEPTRGMHAQDVHNIIEIVKRLSRRNTVVVVTHNKEFIDACDWLVELGPSAGSTGGEIIASGPKKEVISNKTTVTSGLFDGRFMSEQKDSANPLEGTQWVAFNNLNSNNLQDISIQIPIGKLTAITGVSGSGKSSVVSEISSLQDTQVAMQNLRLDETKEPSKSQMTAKQLQITYINQAVPGKNARATVATYLKVQDLIRKEFATANNVETGVFSYNSQGACSECNGAGKITVDMHFLGSLSSTCPKCEGRRYNEQALKYTLKGKNIADVLNMDIKTAYEFFKSNAKILSRLEIMLQLGLDYLKLGQALNTLSGGEGQRLRIGRHLDQTGEMIILDEPSAGLHAKDIARLQELLHLLVHNGQTVVIVEHNLTLIKASDWIIDLGPGGGSNGGEVVIAGTPEDVTKCKRSVTGKWLHEILMKI